MGHQDDCGCHDRSDSCRKQGCKAPTRIRKVPCSITKPGKYCVDRDLQYNGSGVAIEVAADNVSINFYNHSLTLSDPAATGISAVGVSELTILNDRISFSPPFLSVTGTLVYLESVNKATLDNLYLFNSSIALYAVSSSDIHLINSQIRECNASHVAAIDVNGLVIDNCNFYNTKGSELAFGGSYLDSVTNARYTNSQFYNSDIFAFSVTGFTVDKLVSTLDDPDYIFSLLQLGSPSETRASAVNVIVRDSQFTLLKSDSDAAMTFIVQGNNILYENNTFSSSAEIVADIAIVIGTDVLTQLLSDVKVLNNLCSGPASYNIVVSIVEDSSLKGVEISESLLQGATIANLGFISFGARNQIVGVTAKNNTLQNGSGDGIFLDADLVTGSSFLENLIANNCGRAFYISSGCTDNLVADNKAFRNGDGIVDDSTNNLLTGNVEFNNNLECVQVSEKVVKKENKPFSARGKSCTMPRL